jgi:hypothetical protein
VSAVALENKRQHSPTFLGLREEDDVAINENSKDMIDSNNEIRPMKLRLDSEIN